MNDSIIANDSELAGNVSDIDLEILMAVVPIVVPIIFTLVIIVGFVGNLLVVLVVILNKKMRNTTNILIFNLALSDLLFILLCVPFTAADYALTSVWPFGSLWCSMVQYLIIVTVFVSIYTLVLMSLDRFLAVVFPIDSITLRTEKNTILSVILLWIMILGFCVPVFLSHGLVSQDGNNTSGSCVFLDGQPSQLLPDYNWNQSTFQIFFFIFGYFLPLLLIIGLYSVMIFKLLNQAPIGGARGNSDSNKKRVVKLVTIVITTFTVSWLPLQVILLGNSFGAFPFSVTKVSIQIASHVLAYANSCVNPILYAFFSPAFRKAFADLFIKENSGMRKEMTASGKMAMKIALPKLSSEENNEKNGLKINGSKVGVQNELIANNESTKSSSLEEKDKELIAVTSKAKEVEMTSFIENSPAAGKQSNLESSPDDSCNAKQDTNGTAAMEQHNGAGEDDSTRKNNKRNLYKSFHEQVLINNTNLVTL